MDGIQKSKITPQRIAEVLNSHGVDYLIIGKMGAILQGYNGVTQDIDIFPKKETKNIQKLIKGLKELGFKDEKFFQEIRAGKDFIQHLLLDIVFAPDGISSYEKAKEASVLLDERYPVASMRDIIKSKEESGRERDLSELPRLKEFARYLEARKELKSAKEITKG